MNNEGNHEKKELLKILTEQLPKMTQQLLTMPINELKSLYESVFGEEFYYEDNGENEERQAERKEREEVEEIDLLEEENIKSKLKSVISKIDIEEQKSKISIRAAKEKSIHSNLNDDKEKKIVSRHSKEKIIRRLITHDKTLKGQIEDFEFEDLLEIYEKNRPILKQERERVRKISQQNKEIRRKVIQEDGEIDVHTMKLYLIEKIPTYRNEIKILRDSDIREMYYKHRRQKLQKQRERSMKRSLEMIEEEGDYGYQNQNIETERYDMQREVNNFMKAANGSGNRRDDHDDSRFDIEYEEPSEMSEHERKEAYGKRIREKYEKFERAPTYYNFPENPRYKNSNRNWKEKYEVKRFKNESKEYDEHNGNDNQLNENYEGPYQPLMNNKSKINKHHNSAYQEVKPFNKNCQSQYEPISNFESKNEPQHYQNRFNQNTFTINNPSMEVLRKLGTEKKRKNVCKVSFFLDEADFGNEIDKNNKKMNEEQKKQKREREVAKMIEYLKGVFKEKPWMVEEVEKPQSLF